MKDERKQNVGGKYCHYHQQWIEDYSSTCSSQSCLFLLEAESKADPILKLLSRFSLYFTIAAILFFLLRIALSH